MAAAEATSALHQVMVEQAAAETAAQQMIRQDLQARQTPAAVVAAEETILFVPQAAQAAPASS